jgi:23S rRNA (guanosine2251-2'-O)-methyltransferase
METRYQYIYGRHSVREALQFRPDVVTGLWLRDDAKEEIPSVLRQAVSRCIIWSGKKVPVKIDEDAVHQGVIAQIDLDKLVRTYADFATDLVVSPDSAFVILGEVQDPHNVGAVIRSAAAFGVQAVLIPKHRQASITATVIKVSVGMAFKIPLVEIGNVNRTIEDFKGVGCFVYGLAGEGATPLPQEQFTKPSVFVLGNEATGLREKTREHCDSLLTIPIHERCESLNAAASTAAVLYAWSAQHPNALVRSQQ